MGTICSSLLIWLAILYSSSAQTMDTSDTHNNNAQPRSGNPQSIPTLYSEVALKKVDKEAFRKGYEQGMRDSNQVIVSLDAQRQHMLDQNLGLKEKVTEVRAKLEALLRSTSPKSTPYNALQEILMLLERACEPPKH